MPGPSSGLPGDIGRATLKRPPIWPCSGWGLPSRPVSRAAGELLPHLFTLTGSRIPGTLGGVLSVALSLGSPPVGVTHHPALRSPDFPPQNLPVLRRPRDPLQPLSVRKKAAVAKGTPLNVIPSPSGLKGSCVSAHLSKTELLRWPGWQGGRPRRFRLHINLMSALYRSNLPMFA